LCEQLGSESRLGRLYRVVYEGICGRIPNERPWHFQWLTRRLLRRALKPVLAKLSGRVIDVGCGSKPYRLYFGAVSEYIGLDIFPGPQVDVHVQPGMPWPLEDNRFDVVLCTEVLEHVQDLGQMLGELFRVLAPGGILVVTTPFIYNVHGAPP
jgi:SAM-dependent methyltransferase